jgi:hypothetical protein
MTSMGLELLDVDHIELVEVSDQLTAISTKGTVNYSSKEHRSCVCAACNCGGSSGGGNTIGDVCGNDCNTGGSHCSVVPPTSLAGGDA